MGGIPDGQVTLLSGELNIGKCLFAMNDVARVSQRKHGLVFNG